MLGSQPGCRVTHEDGVVPTGTFTATDLVCQDWPVFPAGTPEGFRDLIAAQGEGEEATERFLAEHPDIAEAGATVAAESGQPPLSWATAAFNSLNAFRLVDAHGAGRYVRFRWSPEKGEHSLPPEQRATADPHYLRDGVADELPIRYRLLAQLAHDDDQTTDASKAWPADREWVELGAVEITGPDTERERDGDILVHDPMRLTDGIEPSDDPILRIRTHVYSESVRRRTGVERPRE